MTNLNLNNMALRLFFVILLTTLFISCSNDKFTKGVWRFEIPTDGGVLPFNLDIEPHADGKTYTVYALNATERLKLDSAYSEGDSLVIPMAIFDAELRGVLNGKSYSGFYKKRRTNGTYVKAPFKAAFGQVHRFFKAAKTTHNLSGKWSVLFRSDKNPADSTVAIGVFDQQGSDLSGTFLTPTGDYRYLQGNVNGDSLYLSCYDGNHVFLFKASIKNDTLAGAFWSNFNSRENFKAVRNENAKLPDAKKLTFLKPNSGKLAFAFPDQNGKMISLDHPEFKGKPVVIQILGTWCPNCMDETRFLVDWASRNPKSRLKILGLAFEKSTDLAISGPKIKKLKDRFKVPYPILLAGSNDKAEASTHLPQLNRIIGFPTSIFLNAQHDVVEIHTGFSGPGTGIYYDEWVSDFEKLVEKISK